MKRDWETQSLGDVCEVLDARRRPITKADRLPGPYPYYGATGVVDHVDDYLFDEPLVLIGEDGAKWAAGERSAFEISGRTWVNNHAHVLRPSRGVVLDRWLVYWLNHSDLRPFVTGLTVPKLNQANMRIIPVPVPPLAEQERIVRILDGVFEGIATARANTESNILNVDALSQVTLDEVLEESCARGLRQVFSDVLSSQPRNGWSPPAANHAANGTPVLTLSSVTGFHFQIDKIKYTSAKTDPAAHYWVRDGDLLMTRSNTPRLVGHVAVADGITEPTIYPDLIMRMRLNETQMLTPFAYFLLQTTRSREYLTSRAGGASQTMSKITKRTVQTIPVLVPSLEAQADAVSRLNHVMQGCRAARVIGERKATLLDRLRSATLARAFSGNL